MQSFWREMSWLVILCVGMALGVLVLGAAPLCAIVILAGLS
jgi:hypothetical protein